MVSLRPLEPLTDLVDQFHNVREIGRRQGKQSQLFEACGVDGSFRGIHDLVHAAFPDRAGDHPCLAEPAASRTTAHDLHRHAVVDGLDIRDDEPDGWGRQLGNDAFDDRIGDPFDQGFDVRDSSIVQIMGFVEFRHIHTRESGPGPGELLHG